MRFNRGIKPIMMTREIEENIDKYMGGGLSEQQVEHIKIRGDKYYSVSQFLPRTENKGKRALK